MDLTTILIIFAVLLFLRIYFGRSKTPKKVARKKREKESPERREKAYQSFEKERLENGENDLSSSLRNKKLNDELFIRCQISGISYRSRSEIKRAGELYVGEFLYLEEEPQNAYDSDAIKVITDDDMFIGYIPSYYCSDVKELMQDHPDYDVVVEGVSYGELAPFIDIVIKF